MDLALAIPLAIMIPLVGAVACFVAPRYQRLFGMATVVLLALPVGRCVNSLANDNVADYFSGGWAPPLGIELYLDGAAGLMLAVSWGVGALVTVYAFAYYADERRSSSFWPVWLLLWSGLNALFLSHDAFNLYVTLEIIGIAAVALVALSGGRDAIVAAMRYLLVSLVGSLCYLMGVALLYARYSTVDLGALSSQLDAGPASYVALALMSLGLLMKAAVFPLHFWLPPAHSHAPAPVSALLSALVVKGPLFILYRLWAQAFYDALPLPGAHLLGALACAAIVWASIQALRQVRLKMLVAYSTVAQIGYLVLALAVFSVGDAPLSAWTGGFYFLASHAFAKSAMFLAAGNFLYAAGHDRIEDLPASLGAVPTSMVAFALGGISIVGLPPSGGFLGKWLLLNGALDVSGIFVVVILLGGLLAAAYVLRVINAGFVETRLDPATRKVPRLMEWSALAAGAVAILLGVLSALPIDLLSVGAPGDGPLLRSGMAP
jgi:formate hydrogenlyase subunit 3/multisubunit Na+/H+ antiporter MnhD subunit